MSTALVKSKLKAAREAIGAKDYSKAEQAARYVNIASSRSMTY